MLPVHLHQKPATDPPSISIAYLSTPLLYPFSLFAFIFPIRTSFHSILSPSSRALLFNLLFLFYCSLCTWQTNLVFVIDGVKHQEYMRLPVRCALSHRWQAVHLLMRDMYPGIGVNVFRPSIIISQNTKTSKFQVNTPLPPLPPW